MTDPADRRQAFIREGAKLLGDLFIHRRDAKAVYTLDAKGDHWSMVNKPYTLKDFVAHFETDASLGSYLLDQDSTVKFFAYDIDLMSAGTYLMIRDIEEILALESDGYWDDGIDHETDLELRVGNLEAALHDSSAEAHRWTRIVLLTVLRELSRRVEGELGLKSLSVITGGGAHLLVPLPEPQPAAEVRAAAIDVIDRSIGFSRKGSGDIFWKYGEFLHHPLEVEVFPKQDSLDGKKFGNMIRLPFGIHKEANVRTYAIDPTAVTIPTWNWNKISSMTALRALAAQGS